MISKANSDKYKHKFCAVIQKNKKHKTTFMAPNNYDLYFNCRAFNMTVTEHHTALQHQRIYFVVLMEKKFSNLPTATPITNMQVFF